ncbi:MAG: double-strand break repair helicase AddA [Rhodospirillaceae bacterium]|nr:double-strand break repair helicase AddA [Rhodospirillaceae bacterium]
MSGFDVSDVARRAQKQAIDPTASAWVSASAGSGKTTVLTNRVLALLLAGAAPQRILCLTFTKAAAAEMANRVSQKLSAWVTANESALIDDLATLLTRQPNAQDVAHARRLFALVLDTPGGMRIDTIHAFCQALLRRFPIEAAISPQFELMDERMAAEALAEARDEIIARADPVTDPALADAIGFITDRMHESKFPELIGEVIQNRSKLTRMFEAHGGLNDKGFQSVVTSVRRHLGISADETLETTLARACRDDAFDLKGLQRIAEALSSGAKTDVERGQLIKRWLGAPDRRVDTYAKYTSAYLTGTGEIRKRLATQEALALQPDAGEVLAREGSRLIEVNERLKRIATVRSTSVLLCIAQRMLDAYKVRKRRRALVDYDDLIQTARRLLHRPGIAAWVLYKHDGGIEHVLIDEAQDTNPEQWDIIAALTAEFFAGEGSFEDRVSTGPPLRTVFAVGDRKQSIYSFQGADPEGFERLRGAFAARVHAMGREWRDVTMNVSFRSSWPVLKAVDAVLADPVGRDGVVRAGEDIAHLANREESAGRVELWPPVVPRPTDEPAPWKPPVERVRGDSPQNRLAGLIARHIEHLIASKEVLSATGTPITAGDIMVLVRRRTGFVDELVRRLKELRIPVAGVDRMIIPEQIAVMDLMALGAFLLLPQDDLTLATVLKSPLVGLNEEELFVLANGRGRKTLWDALCEHAGAETALGQAQAVLADLLAKVDYLTPHALFSRVLVALDGRRKALGRLGFDADDPIDEFLSLALQFERAHTPSLQAFLHWVERGQVQIKRDLDQGAGDAVRIMTVHGAKGLQAPIVILPDTLQVPSMRDSLLWTEDASLMLWPASAGEADSVASALREAAKARQMQEHRRLLYVAMTRAEDRLYVCGWETQRKVTGGTWYHLVQAAMTRVGTPMTSAFLESQGAAASKDILVLEKAHVGKLSVRKKAGATIAESAVPAWATTTPPPERDPPRPLAPSRSGTAEPAVISPLGADQTHRFQRGLIIHRLLQSLPDLPPKHRRAAAESLTARTGAALPAAERADIVDETLRVLDDPRFAALFGPGSLAEVPIVGLIGRHAVSGQVDRLLVTDHDVTIIDYKTNRPSPPSPDKVDPAYVFQMAVYKGALARIYPEKPVRCVLLWTNAPVVMELDSGQLDGVLAQIAGQNVAA